jgi:hypothetical protein
LVTFIIRYLKILRNALSWKFENFLKFILFYATDRNLYLWISYTRVKNVWR